MSDIEVAAILHCISERMIEINTLKVRITKSNSPNSWYNELMGMVFRVYTYDGVGDKVKSMSRDVDDTYYYVVSDVDEYNNGGLGNIRCIDKEDCEVL